MATKKKVVDEAVEPAVTVEAAESFETVASQNISEISAIIQSNAQTIDLLTSKITSLACHVTALEALLSEVVKITGVDLVKVNSAIRTRIKSVNGELSDTEAVVDIAASIATPAIKSF